jgi:hypothetical protein
MASTAVWKVEFFEDASGKRPVEGWLGSLRDSPRLAATAALAEILAKRGTEVCKTEFGKNIGGGLFEFRIRHDERSIMRKAGRQAVDSRTGDREILLRIFFHPCGERSLVLLHAYDKLASPSKRHQSKAIERARKHLRSFKLQGDRSKAAARKNR